MTDRMTVSQKESRWRLAALAASLVVAAVLWYFVFDFPRGIFWVKMAVATPILAAISLTQIVRRRKNFRAFRPRHLLVGAGSAAVLYGIFYAGNVLLPLLLPQSHRMVASVYATGRALPHWAVALLLLFVTSPAEEIYWRRFVQRTLGERWGRLPALFATAGLYTLVHVVTLNPALIIAAFVAGSMWGLLYYREGSIAPTIISHALWATTIFVLLPVGA
jgi:CAAX protease family protein